jgi:acyl-CoA synthetase (AMP-forming)/AMP-acid ligase II
MPVENLRDLLDEVGQSRSPRGLIAYPLGNTETSRTMTYRDLRETAIHNSLVLRAIEGFSQGSVILLHFNEHLDNITWFWSVLYAGCIPALSTPFTNNASQRDKHIKHLHTLLGDPMCLTRSASLSDFPTQPILKVLTIESLGEGPASSETGEFQLSTIHPGDTAALMLTSGSTGDSKAVCLSHEQVLSAIKGKASIRPVGGGFSCLNWTGIDHVAGLVEIHLLALHFNVDQIHVQAPDLIANPRKFLSLIDKHRVARSFAPNFFLAKLRREIKTQTLNGYTASNGHAVPNGHKVSNGNAFSNGHSNGIAHPNGSATPKYGHSDLSCLRFIASGGEANPIETCIAVSELLMEYGTPRNVIVPGFGMTETCAGSIYNTESMDHVNGLDFASVGTCVPGIKMRITTQSETPRIAEIGETGDLEVSGKIVFKEYFNNPSATKAAFTHDGWFKTGDRALIDSAGKLNLVGRSKETMTINGIKYVPHEIETALEEALIPGVASSYIVCFSFRPRGQKSETEQICIVYLPTFAADDDEARVRASDAIVKTVMIQTSIRPQVLPLEISLLHKTTLGKLSRTKIRTAFEKGEYKDYENYNASVLAAYRAAHFEGPKNELEALLLQEFEETLELEGQHSLGVDTPVFEMGITSIDLIKASHRIEQRLNSPMKIPIIMSKIILIISIPQYAAQAAACVSSPELLMALEPLRR